jgi:hypothetical protein
MTKCKRIFFYGFSCVFILIVLLFLTIYMVFEYKPTTPKFSLVKIDILEFKISGTILSSTIKIDLLSTNPNKNISMNYDEFRIYAKWNNQNITNESIVPLFNKWYDVYYNWEWCDHCTFHQQWFESSSNLLKFEVDHFS